MEDLVSTEEVRTKKEGNNPAGIGGFQDRPQDRNPGGRPKNANSITYWLNILKNLPVKDFVAWKENNPDMTMAALSAYARVENMVKSLKEFKTVADRTEGTPMQYIDHTSKGEKIIPILGGMSVRVDGGNEENPEPKEED